MSESRTMVIETSGVLSEVHHQLETVARRLVNHRGVDGDGVGFDRVDLLRSLLVRWRGGHGRGARREVKPDRWDMAFGFHGAFDVISGRSEVGSAAASPIDVVDESKRGLRAVVSTYAGAPVRIGEPVAMRRAGRTGSWSIGLVQWTRATTADEISFGVRILGLRTAPAQLRPDQVSADDGTRPPQQAICVASTPGAGFSLVTAAGTYHPTKTLSLRALGREAIIECSDLLSSTRWIDWFEFRSPGNSDEALRLCEYLYRFPQKTRLV